MKSIRIALALFTAVRALSLAAEDVTPPPSPPAPAETFMIVDLEKPLAGIFQYGSWDGKIGVSKSGLTILGAKGAQGNGGFGHDLPAPIDCRDVSYFEAAIGTAPGNEVPAITIALNDADGTQYSARITVDNLVPGQPVWIRARREDFHLNDVERGSDGKMDWSQVTRWHLQGDWTTMQPMKIVFIALRARR